MPVENVAATVSALKAVAAGADDLDGWDQVEQLVQDAAERHEPTRTGALRASTRPIETASGAVVSIGGPTVKYAGFVNYGTRRMAGAEFVAKVDAEVTPKVEQLISDSLDDLIHRNGLKT